MRRHMVQPALGADAGYRSDMSRSVALGSRLCKPRGRREQPKAPPPSKGPHGSQAGGGPLMGT